MIQDEDMEMWHVQRDEDSERGTMTAQAEVVAAVVKDSLSALAGEEVMARGFRGAAETSSDGGGSGHPPGRVRKRKRVGCEHLPGEERRVSLAGMMREGSRPSWEESPSGGHSASSSSPSSTSSPRSARWMLRRRALPPARDSAAS